MNEARTTHMNGGHPAIDTVKIYGERNTGTHFLASLFQKNFRVDVLEGTNNADEKAERAEILKSLGMRDPMVRTLVRNTYEAMIHPAMLEDRLGWKHMSPPIEFLQSIPERTKHTLFVVLVKHPVFWAQSFQRRPYHSYFDYDDMSFGEFLRHPYIPAGRDNVDKPLYASVVELYAAKIDGYRRLKDMGVAFDMIRYEDLVRDVPAYLTHIENTFALARRRQGDAIRKRAFKNDDSNLDEYAEKYRLENVKTSTTPEDYEFVLREFGADRLAWLGYPY